jgi:hypothetical protein
VPRHVYGYLPSIVGTPGLYLIPILSSGSPIVNKLFAAVTTAFRSSDWTDTLVNEISWLFDFSGLKYHFVDYVKGQPFFQVKMPVPGKEDRFKCDDYAKHLVGNAFSIPVMEHLLRPLQNIFAAQQYMNVNHEFPWGYLQHGYDETKIG